MNNPIDLICAEYGNVNYGSGSMTASHCVLREHLAHLMPKSSKDKDNDVLYITYDLMTATLKLVRYAKKGFGKGDWKAEVIFDVVLGEMDLNEITAREDLNTVEQEKQDKEKKQKSRTRAEKQTESKRGAKVKKTV